MTDVVVKRRLGRGPIKTWQVPGRVFRLAGVLALALAFAPPLGAVRARTVPVGSDVSGAPFEYYPPHPKAAMGFDVDLLQALGSKMGTTFVVTNHQFEDLLKAVKGGRFQMAMSAISDTPQREKLVDFVDYFVAGGGIMVRKHD